MGFFYFVTDVSSLLRNDRIAVPLQRATGRPREDEALTWKMRSWRDSAIEYPGSHLVGSARPKTGANADHPIQSRSYSEEQIHEPDQTILLGWSISALIHAFILAVLIVINLYVPPLRAIPQKEPFRWEVSFTAAPKIEAVVADGIESQETAADEETDPGEIVDARPLEQVEEHSSHREESVLQEKPAPTVFPKQSAHQKPAASEKPLKKADGLKQAALMPVTSRAESVLPPPEVESQRDSNSLQVETELERPTVIQRPQRVTRPLVSRIALPDYGWLMETLRAKLERMKVYPPSAKASHVEGRVVVRISIQSDGHIANLEIEESSGYPVLDRAALEALQAASPLTLDHRLERTPILMLVPLSYQLE